jgi:hypothetical protein
MSFKHNPSSSDSRPNYYYHSLEPPLPFSCAVKPGSKPFSTEGSSLLFLSGGVRYITPKHWTFVGGQTCWEYIEGINSLLARKESSTVSTAKMYNSCVTEMVKDFKKVEACYKGAVKGETEVTEDKVESLVRDLKSKLSELNLY